MGHSAISEKRRFSTVLISEVLQSNGDIVCERELVELKVFW